MANNWQTTTDDYDIYSQGGDTVSSRPGSPTVDENGHFVWDSTYFPQSTPRPIDSVMDPNPQNTGPTNDFWTTFPITIDVSGYLFYNGENTGINVRGPAGASELNFDELTPAQKASLKGDPGENGINGTNGRDGLDGANGLDAYQLWLVDNGWADDPEHHPHSEFYAYLANLENALIKEGSGTGSLILNYRGQYNVAPGTGALAAGYGTAANGSFSFALGNNTIAANPYQVAFGVYNKTKTNSILEIGNGEVGNRSNALWLSKTGNLTTAGEIKDGNNNILSNKVDKVAGKGLSTNDFDNTYKAFIDNYHVDDGLNIGSLNPVTNSAITTAMNLLAAQNGKPEQVEVTTENEFYGFFHPDSLIDGTLAIANFTDNLLYNPNRVIFANSGNTIGIDAHHCIVFGQNLTAGYSNQTVIGKNNANVSGDLFEIGNGVAGTPSNAFRVNDSGNAYAAGTFIDGLGNDLSQKQDLLTYDSVPTEDSDNLITSGDLYDYLVAHGFDPEGGIILPEVTLLRNEVAALSAQVTTLTNIVNGLLNPREFIDDTYTYKTYILGVNQDKLYIRLKEDPEPEDDDEEDDKPVEE